MADSETRQARAAVIMLTGAVSLVLAAIVFFRPMPGDCAVFPNGVIDCGPQREVTTPLVLATLGCLLFAVGFLLLRIRASIQTPSEDHQRFGPAATKRAKGFGEWCLSLSMPSVAAAPIQMTFMGGVAIAFGLFSAWVSPGPLFGPVGLLLLGILGIYGASEEARKTDTARSA